MVRELRARGANVPLADGGLMGETGSMVERLPRKYRGTIAGLMLLAVATSVVAPDHWLQPWLAAAHGMVVEGSHSHAHSHAPGDDGHHSRHCHGDAASCSNVPLTGFSGLALLALVCAFAAPFVAGARTVVARATLRPWQEFPPTPPPRILVV